MYLEKYDLKNRVAVVAGGGQAIGLACVEALAEAGARVVIADYNEKVAEDGRDAMKAKGYACDVAVVDVTNAKAIDALADKLGKVDILVNNAGIARDQLMLRMKRADWDEVMATNLTAAFTCVQAVLKPMVKQRAGRIVSISSVVGQMGNSGQANYAASKAGLIGFTMALAREVASRNITVNVVAPGLIETDMTKAITTALGAGQPA